MAKDNELMAELLVTGCAGFIGSHLCERLIAQGHRVTGIDNFDPFYPREIKERNISALRTSSSFVLREIDIRDEKGLLSLDGDFSMVIHLASKAGVRPSIADPASYFSVNVDGTLSLLSFMQKKGIRKMIFGSSSSIYGNNKKTPFSETDEVNRPISPYAASKRSAELLNHCFHHLHDLDILNLRFFTVFGPRQRPDLAIYKFVDLISKGKPIPFYGDGSTSRDYTYISDIVDGIQAAQRYLEQHTCVYEVLNLGNNYPVSLSTMVSSLREAMEKKVNIEHLPMQPGDVDITFADITRARQILNYSPKMRFEDGLREFVNWYHSLH